MHYTHTYTCISDKQSGWWHTHTNSFSHTHTYTHTYIYTPLLGPWGCRAGLVHLYLADSSQMGVHHHDVVRTKVSQSCVNCGKHICVHVYVCVVWAQDGRILTHTLFHTFTLTIIHTYTHTLFHTHLHLFTAHIHTYAHTLTLSLSFTQAYPHYTCPVCAPSHPDWRECVSGVLWIRLRVCVCVCMWVRVWVCMWVCVWEREDESTCEWMSVCTYTYVQVCGRIITTCM
jgi:hypothetical protein